MELSHAGPRTQANSRLPGKPETLPGAGCSDFVRPRLVHISNSLRTHLLWQLNESRRLPEISATLFARETLDLALRNLLAADHLFHSHLRLDGRVRSVKIIHSENGKHWVLLSHGARIGQRRSSRMVAGAERELQR